MSYKGTTQITFVFTATPEQVSEGDRLFASHEVWMQKTHTPDGNRALLNYTVSKGPEISNPLDPSSEPTGNTTFALTEIYESPAGVEDHWKQAPTWSEFSDFVNWAGQVKLTVLHGSPVVAALW